LQRQPKLASFSTFSKVDFWPNKAKEAALTSAQEARNAAQAVVNGVGYTQPSKLTKPHKQLSAPLKAVQPPPPMLKCRYLQTQATLEQTKTLSADTQHQHSQICARLFSTRLNRPF